jgi:hypothetical protein
MAFKESVKSLNKDSKVVVKNQLNKIKVQARKEFEYETDGTYFGSIVVGSKRLFNLDAESIKEALKEAVVIYATIDNDCDQMITELDLEGES